VPYRILISDLIQVLACFVDDYGIVFCECGFDTCPDCLYGMLLCQSDFADETNIENAISDFMVQRIDEDLWGIWVLEREVFWFL
jgi:hypothetical protein